MKGDLVEIVNKTAQILRIMLLGNKKITTVQFFDSTRKIIDLNEYVWDREKKVWKK